jgi:glycerophosphoryl diester phosphodiesterase
MRRCDSIFGLPVPLLFAHRGGAKEAPESTKMAFEHAREARSDVLEFDVSLTRDRKIVVWHGPAMENVRIAVENDDIGRRTRTQIGDFDWTELANHAWVGDHREIYTSVANVPEDPDRTLLLLEDLLTLFPNAPLSIELKGSFESMDVDNLLGALENSPGERRVLIVSANQGNLRRVRRQLERLPGAVRERYALGFSALQVLGATCKAWLPFISVGSRGGAVQTPHWRPLCTRRLVEKVHDQKGAVHAFITSFGPIPGLDQDEGNLDREALFGILERGVDGIMTDRPAEVRPLLDEWILRNADPR